MLLVEVMGVLGAADGRPPSGLLELHEVGHPAFRCATSESHTHQEACGSRRQAVRGDGCSRVRLAASQRLRVTPGDGFCPAVPRSTGGILGQ